ncbi:MAG: exodeoxyribonuclease VII large subunit [Rhodospirillales bacterium]|nr:exodeoxyribonuclease VII large subunit [Rhodospirillales bacterium]
MSKKPSTIAGAPSDPRDPDGNLPILTVSEISALLKRTVEESFARVRVRGEISGFKRAASGHLYFALKDADAVLDAVAWRGTVGRLGLKPEDGMEVVATGRLTTYPGRSRYQIVVEALELAGEGALLKLLEERRKKLAAEGLFDASRKKPLPFLPDVIGVVTSPTGAVIRDILHRLADRFPRRVLLWPVPVQGEGAAEKIAAAINGFNCITGKGKAPRPDLLIVARGGGSLEDLWAFNEEVVVRAAAASLIPLISAVGHETDTTLIDFAADARAPTPTAAAEMAVPVRAELVATVEDLGARLVAAAARLIGERRTRLNGLVRALPDLKRLVEELVQRLDDRAERLAHALRAGMNLRRQRLAIAIPRPHQQIAHSRKQLKSEMRALKAAAAAFVRERRRAFDHFAALLESFSYQRVLERGFALVTDGAGNPIESVARLSPGMGVRLRLSDGEAGARITDVAGRGGKNAKPKKPKPGGDGRQGTLL